MATYATHEDVSTNLGRPLTPMEQAQADLWLGWAEAAIEARMGDLSALDLPAAGIAAPFDVIVCAGNVLTFLAPGTLGDALAGMRAHLVPGGRAVIGLGAGRGVEFRELLDDAQRVGLATDVLLSTWDLRPFTEDSNFMVAILGKAS